MWTDEEIVQQPTPYIERNALRQMSHEDFPVSTFACCGN
jgi:hypothetical protein